MTTHLDVSWIEDRPNKEVLLQAGRDSKNPDQLKELYKGNTTLYDPADGTYRKRCLKRLNENKVVAA